MLTAHILMMLIPGIVTPISTEQIFESKVACEIAKEALTSTDSVNGYLCTSAPYTTPNR